MGAKLPAPRASKPAQMLQKTCCIPRASVPCWEGKGGVQFLPQGAAGLMCALVRTWAPRRGVEGPIAAAAPSFGDVVSSSLALPAL